MALTEDQKTALNFKKFLAAILPYIGGGGGHTIKDSDDTEMTQRANLKFGGDFEVSDDSENELTEVAPHRLTSEELEDICSPLPASTVNLPVLFDESGAEYVVGRYVNSHGKWKPVYRKNMLIASNISASNGAIPLPNIDVLIDFGGTGIFGANNYVRAFPWILSSYTCSINSWDSNSLYYYGENGGNNNVTLNAGSKLWFQYTKTTDDWQD